MPELPEVDLVAQSLNTFLRNRTILRTTLYREKLVPHQTKISFEESINQLGVNFVHRRGKNILIDLSNSLTLLVHLRMSGRFMILPTERENPKHAHAIFELDDETRLVFQDQRHFGLMKLIKTAELSNSSELSKLAPEPFSIEFNLRYFQTVLASSKRSIKSILLDQTKICGLGNIYACEALFISKINPEISGNLIKSAAAKRLLSAAKEVLSESIKESKRKTVDPENIDGSYFDGSFEDRWRVYDQEGKDCIVCKKPIVRLIQNGRSTYYCPKCQKR
jgi:formamidopyrimidine-DNA glycosylase